MPSRSVNNTFYDKISLNISDFKAESENCLGCLQPMPFSKKKTL